MAVVFRTIGSNSDTAATSIVIPKPSGTVENDLLICEIATDGNAVITTLSGWTLIQGGGVNPLDNTPAHGVYYKKATSSEPSDYTWAIDSTESISGCILRYDGQNLTNPINVSDHSESTGSVSPQAPDITTTVDGCMIICSAAMDDDDTPYSVPSGMNERYNVTATTHGHMIADLVQSIQGSTGTAWFSQNAAEEWYCFTIAIAPAAEGETFYQNTGQGTTSLTGTLATVITFAQTAGAYALIVAGNLIKKTSVFTGGYSVTTIGNLAKKISIYTGKAAMVIAGTLTTATIFLQNTGQAATAIAGGLTMITIFTQTAGTYAITIAGNLAKKTMVFMGGYSVVLAGSLIKKVSIYTGKAAIVITGTLTTATIFLQSTGQAAMTILGSLAKVYTAGSGAVKRGIALLLRFM